ncbi:MULTISPECIES: hypothetical protein [Pseudomonas]|uniref:hypothetical protein n=1 Tax=Pseudomonas TaxID=286 RepID=UPI001B42F1D4|nr:MULTISPECIES: hypothetical protein [unclassified Pseudomonas]MBP1124987.1 hypothetical protein [Pseudomonas sp. PvP025]MDQ0398847.1 hypothetical protein [Pseudomonas sp. PvP006]
MLGLNVYFGRTDYSAAQMPSEPASRQNAEGLISALGVLGERLRQLSERRSGRYDTHEVNRRRITQAENLDPGVGGAGRFIRGTAANIGIKPADVFTDFYQNVEGNCVTISAIKAAMMRFGHNPHGVFKRVQATATGVEVVMRDAYRLRISYAELEQAGKASDFKADRPNDVLVNAQFLYAVSAKRAQLENNDGVGHLGYAAALNSLNDGEYPGQALRRLGLKNYVTPATLEDFRQGAIGTVSGLAHSMAVIDGKLDNYGKASELRESDWSNRSIIGLKLL